MNPFWSIHRICSGLFCVLLLCCLSTSLYAQSTSCTEGSELQHTFSSGASWRLCANVSATHGLEISNVAYRAPGDSSRLVLAEAHVSQILLQYHDSPIATPQITPILEEMSSTQQIMHAIKHTAATCQGDVLSANNDTTKTICNRVINNRVLAKYSQRPSLHSQAWELSSFFIKETLTWTVAFIFTEDGRLKPQLRLSGRANRSSNNSDFATELDAHTPRLTRAMLVPVWRLVPSLNGSTSDVIEQFDFELSATDDNRRTMRITPFTVESQHQVDRRNFRGWLIKNPAGIGYYLDPADSAYRFKHQQHLWANYDLTVTRLRNCERYATQNPIGAGDEQCASNLSDFVNNESLIGEQSVLWFSMVRALNPSIEDWPVLREMQLGFELLPFDWTDTSPFEVVEQ